MEEKIINMILFGGISIFCFIKYLTIVVKMKKYTKIKGKVISVKKSYITTGESVNEGAHNKYIFEYDGNKLQIEDKLFGGNPKLKIGDDVYCCIRKEDKKIILSPESIYYKNIYLLAGMVFVIIIFIF